jgi:hypothetical protein
MSDSSSKARYSAPGILAGAWGVGGMALVLIDAATRLSKYMLEAFTVDWSLLHWTLFLVNTGFMAYAEGYRGFQKSFVPRTVARGFQLAANPTWVNGLLAPLYCVGYFGAGKRTAKVVWMGTALIVVAIVLIRQVPQPWRGIIDAGVVVGLSWGVAATCIISLQALFSGRVPVPAVRVASAELK